MFPQVPLPLFVLPGGHSTEILRRLSKDGRLWAFDLDPNAVAVGQKLAAMDSRFKILHRPFADVQVAWKLNVMEWMGEIGFTWVIIFNEEKVLKSVLLGILDQKSGIDSSHMTWSIQHDRGWNGWNGRIFSAFCYLFKHHQLSIPSHQQVSLPDVELSGMLLDIGFSSPQARENSSHWGDQLLWPFQNDPC